MSTMGTAIAISAGIVVVALFCISPYVSNTIAAADTSHVRKIRLLTAWSIFDGVCGTVGLTALVIVACSLKGSSLAGCIVAIIGWLLMLGAYLSSVSEQRKTRQEIRVNSLS